MKRPAWREFLPLFAPILIIGAGAALVGLQAPAKIQRMWAAHAPSASLQPTITECEFRPATPLEMYLGAGLGVTVRAVAPNTNSLDNLRFKLLPPPGAKATGLEEVRASDMNLHGGDIKLEQNYAYRWPTAELPKGNFRADVSADVQFPLPKSRLQRRFEMNLADLTEPNINTARQSNFRITKVTLWDANIPKDNEYKIRVNFTLTGVEAKTTGLAIRPECLGNWSSRGADNRSLKGDVESWGDILNSQSPEFSLLLSATNYPIRLKNGTRFSGLVSVGGGWPQKITVECGPQPDLNSNGRKFWTELAPMPQH